MDKSFIKNKSTLIIVTVILATLMLATRYYHFGSALHLPDASLAIFFLAGFYVSRTHVFIGLLLLAGLIDYAAINFGNVSDFCISPAYWFLIPTYAFMWYGGTWFKKKYQPGYHALLPLLAILFTATSAAFLLSNGSFYLLSGKIPDMSFSQYIKGVVKYYPPYVFSTFAYMGVASLIHISLMVTRDVNHDHNQSKTG